MFSAIYQFFQCKFFSKKVTGRKRRIEGCSDSPPKKILKVDDSDSMLNRTDSSVEFKDLMESKENHHFDKDDGCCIVAEVTKKKWDTMHPVVARKNARKNHCDPDISIISSTKLDINSGGNVQNQSFLSNAKDVEIVKCITDQSCKKSVTDVKNKTVSDRIFRSFKLPNGNSNNVGRNRGTSASFQNNMRKRLSFLREGYLLGEKYQYRQLLQSFTSKTSTFFSLPSDRPEGNRSPKNAIPLIDLTKEKSNMTVNRSRENIPWTLSCSKNDENCAEGSSSSLSSDKVPRVNSFQEYLKTNPVTEEDVVQQILSRHTKAITEKRKQVALESAKLEILSDSSKQAYDSVFEERFRAYMRITSPAVAEADVEVKEKYALPQLSAEQESQVNKALVPSPPGQILAEKFGLQIKRRDMQTLKGLNWLNDEVINFYMNLIMERGKNSKLPNVYAFNTFFYPKLISSGHASLKRWTKKVDIFSYEMVFVPVHLGMHWCMSVIDFRAKEVRYYDSMGSTNNACLRALLTYLEDESMDKKKTSYSTKDWKRKNVDDIPQQMNGSDCGVFSCVFAEHLSRDTPMLFTQEDMPYFRRKMVLEILEGKLLT